MKNEEKKVYSAPEIEVVEVQVEQGFAQSSQLDDMKETEGEWY